MTDKLETVLNLGLRYIFEIPSRTRISPYRRALEWNNLKGKRMTHLMIMMYKIKNGLAPEEIASIHRAYTTTHEHNTRGIKKGNDICVYSRTNAKNTSTIYSAINEWNKLPEYIRSGTSVQCFRSRLIAHYKLDERFI
jgi:hypothetical protein